MKRIDPVDKVMALWREFTDVQLAEFNGRVKEHRLLHAGPAIPAAPRKRTAKAAKDTEVKRGEPE